MNSVQVHLALTHVPVILSLVGLVMLAVALLRRNQSITRASYIILLIAGIASIPVYFTGEGTEEAIEKLPGVSGSIIEEHEEVATLAMIAISAAGFISLLSLFTFKWQRASKMLRVILLLLAFTSGGLMVQTAHLGGQIRHSEIRSGASLQNSNEQAEPELGKEQHKDEEQKD